MYLKSSEIYIIVGTISIIVVFLAFCPIEIITINNQTMFNTFFNLKFEDGGVFAAITVGIITVLVTGYYNVKNYKSMKLASIPTNSANLLIDLEYIFKPFDELEPQEKYSNIRQAKSISKNLKIIGCKLALTNDEHEEYTPSETELEDLGMYEHKDWYCEKITAGWSPGDEKDEVNLINPNLVSWEKLDENARKFNIDTYRNLPNILETIGLKIIANNTRLLTAELHEYYNEIYGENNPFDDLDIDDKYFNYTQTGQMIKALNKKGYSIVPIDDKAEAITEFSPEELEFLAKNEHEQWCEYKAELGWVYGDEKSVENRTNPKLREWETLDEETRQFNINTYKNLPRLCSNEKVGLKIVRA